ncbi:MAG: thioredoxin family protein [Dechloromonas sp.]|uniref:Thioredoxin family protein n=1 Tax=Candidatus Dechloromonas phosphorivorans TaxID=2899244 RepID=A0A935K877_9RHOO|nr:thioredoxin family protein [Candidatus Dechloromonas phosphorivorans]
MLIKILGTGCAKCNRLEQLAKEIAAELKLTATFEHVTEMQDIMAYQVMSTPALVINEVVKSSGRIPSRGEIAGWLQGG